MDEVAVALGRLDFDSLTGLSVKQARARVEKAGVVRAVPPSHAINLCHLPAGWDHRIAKWQKASRGSPFSVAGANIAASIGLGGSDGPSVNLSDAIASLGRKQLELVLAGLAHADGSHDQSDVAVDHIAGRAAVVTLDSLHPWPTQWPVA